MRILLTTAAICCLTTLASAQTAATRPAFAGTTVSVQFDQTPLRDALNTLAAVPGAPALTVSPAATDPLPVTLTASQRPWLEVVAEVCTQAGWQFDFEPSKGAFHVQPPPKPDIGMRASNAPFRSSQVCEGGVLIQCESVRFDQSIEYGTPPKQRNSILFMLRLLAEPRANVFAVDPKLASMTRSSGAAVPRDWPTRVSVQFLYNNFSWAPPVAAVDDVRLGVNLLVAEDSVEFKIDDVLNAAGKVTHVGDRSITVKSVTPNGDSGYTVLLDTDFGIKNELLAMVDRGIYPFALEVQRQDGASATASCSKTGKTTKHQFLVDIWTDQTEPRPSATLRWKVPLALKTQPIAVDLKGFTP